MSNFNVRILSGIVYILLIFLGTHYLGYDFIKSIFGDIDNRKIYLGFIIIMYCFCAYELVNVMQFQSIFLKIIGILVGALPLYYFGVQLLNVPTNFHFEFRKLLLVAPSIIALITIFRFPEELDNIDSSKLIFIVCYLGMSFGLALTLQNFSSLYPAEVFFIFLLIWASDSFAYLIGRKFGKTPLAPKISPKKSREGLIGGVICTVIVGIIIQFTMGYLQGNWIIIAIIVGITAPIGDLAESQIKRTFGVKDSSQLIPGHGGFLDRLDSFIGVVPFVYLYFLISNI